VGAALTVALIYILRIPMFLPFLEYDPGDIPIYFCTFIFGPVAGFIMTAVASIIQGLTVSAASGWIGIIMHIFATGSFVLTAGIIYSRKKTTARLFLGSAAGLIVTVITMAAWNRMLTPAFMNAPVSAVMELMPAIIAFNLVKVLINAGAAIIIYKSLYKYIKH
jgi:riboflavin transporter FmnP